MLFYKVLYSFFNEIYFVLFFERVFECVWERESFKYRYSYQIKNRNIYAKYTKYLIFVNMLPFNFAKSSGSMWGLFIASEEIEEVNKTIRTRSYRWSPKVFHEMTLKFTYLVLSLPEI